MDLHQSIFFTRSRLHGSIPAHLVRGVVNTLVSTLSSSVRFRTE